MDEKGYIPKAVVNASGDDRLSIPEIGTMPPLIFFLDITLGTFYKHFVAKM